VGSSAGNSVVAVPVVVSAARYSSKKLTGYIRMIVRQEKKKENEKKNMI
jgi:hypothetical protein